MKAFNAAAPYHLTRMQRAALLEANGDYCKRGEAATQVIGRLVDLGLAVRLTDHRGPLNRQGIRFNLTLTEAGVALAQEIETAAALRAGRGAQS